MTSNFLSSKKIADLLGSLPDPEFLSLLKSIDQSDYFSTLTTYCQTIAMVWAAEQNFQTDPLEPLLKAGQLSRMDYIAIVRHVAFYQCLWVLVQRTEPFIREEFEKVNARYPFQCPYELFACIVRELVNNQFSLCLAPYLEISALKSEKRYRLIARFLGGALLTEEQRKTLKMAPTRARLAKTPWSQLLDDVARRKATGTRIALKDALENFYQAAARLAEVAARQARRDGSFAWFDGERRKGDRDSTYKSQRKR